MHDTIAMTSAFPFLHLPAEIQVYLLAFFAPDELHASLTLSRHVHELITSDWVWREAFLRRFGVQYPLIAAARCWRLEYSLRARLWRKVADHVVNLYTTNVGAVTTDMYLDGKSNVFVADSSTVVRFQMVQGRQSQLTRHMGRSTTHVLDRQFDGTRTAILSQTRLQLFLNTPTSALSAYRQIDLPLSVPGVRLALVRETTSSSRMVAANTNSTTCVIALATSALEYVVVVEQFRRVVRSAPLEPGNVHDTISVLRASSRAAVAVLGPTVHCVAMPTTAAQPGVEDDADLGGLGVWGAHVAWHAPGVVDDVAYSDQTHPIALVRVRAGDEGSGPTTVYAVNVDTAALVAVVAHDDTMTDGTAWVWMVGDGPWALVPQQLTTVPAPNSDVVDATPSPSTAPKSWPIRFAIMLGTATGTVRVFSWDYDPAAYSSLSPPTRGTLIHVLRGHASPIAALHMDATMLVTAAKTGWVRIWDPASGKSVRRVQMRSRGGGAAAEADRLISVRGTGLAGNGRIAVAYASGAIRILEPYQRRFRRNGKRASALGGVSNGGRSPLGSAGGRAATQDAHSAEIASELRDLHRASAERVRHEQSAARMNGDADLTEEELMQLALLMSQESLTREEERFVVPGLPDLVRDEDTAMAMVMEEMAEDEHGYFYHAASPPAPAPLSPPHAGEGNSGVLSAVAVQQWNVDADEDEALRRALEQSLFDQ
ncbi:hypothetical protein BC828DRAFT_25807 [Blastocladiella britannica]|nr:hypothetical protein BC828DRAFT_25807 [Blastocladiella britannica]